MASITITNFYAKIPKKNITTTIARLEYGCSVSRSENSGYSVDNRKNSIGEYIEYTYSHGVTNYKWEFSLGSTKNTSTSQSNSYTYAISPGTSYAFNASLTVSFGVAKYKQVTIYKYVNKLDKDNNPIPELDENGDPKVDENGDPVYEQEIKGFPQQAVWDSGWTVSDTEDISYNIYTPPTVFTDYNFNKDTIIQSSEGLSTIKVSKWCTHAGKYLSWKDQEDRYNDANYLKVIEYFGEEKPVITAAWYNDCAELVGCTTRVSNKHNQADSLITAQIFKDLGAAISP